MFAVWRDGTPRGLTRGMNKVVKKPIHLHIETVRVLDVERLGLVVGGSSLSRCSGMRCLPNASQGCPA